MMLTTILVLTFVLIASSLALVIGVRSPPARPPSFVTSAKILGGAVFAVAFLPWILVAMTFAVAFTVLTAPVMLPMIALWGHEPKAHEEETGLGQPHPQYV